MLNLIKTYYTVKEFLIDTGAVTTAGFLKVATNSMPTIDEKEMEVLSWLTTASMAVFVFGRAAWVINKIRISRAEVRIKNAEADLKEAQLKRYQNE